MITFKSINSLVLASAFALVVNHCSIDAARTGSTRRPKSFDEPYTCATANELADRVDYCALPVMEMITGSLKKWPANEDDTMELCDKFAGSEKCIKEASRKCAKGIQKSIVSTVGSSVQRVRKRECTRAKAEEILRTTKCIESVQNKTVHWMTGVMSRLNAIETNQAVPEKKVNSICCMINDIERELKVLLDPHCPEQAKFVQRLFRGVVENAMEIICRNPKCNDYMKGLKLKPTNEHEGLVSSVLRMVFSLESAD